MNSNLPHISASNFCSQTHWFISTPNSNRHTLATHRTWKTTTAMKTGRLSANLCFSLYSSKSGPWVSSHLLSSPSAVPFPQSLTPFLGGTKQILVEHSNLSPLREASTTSTPTFVRLILCWFTQNPPVATLMKIPEFSHGQHTGTTLSYEPESKQNQEQNTQ